MRKSINIFLINFSMVVLCIGYVSTSYSSDAKYKEENILVKNKIGSMHVKSKETLTSRSKKYNYSVKNLFDNNRNTAWVTRFNATTPITIDDQLKITFVKPVYVRAITIRNGFHKNKGLYYKNHRAKILIFNKILIGNVPFPYEDTIHLEDKMTEQKFSLKFNAADYIELLKTKELTINVLDIYKGSKYDDLCISDIELEISNNIDYKPSVSWKNLESKIRRNAIYNGNNWDWPQLMEDEFQLFNDLLFYTLTGNGAAYSIFSKYVPHDKKFLKTLNIMIKKSVKETLSQNKRPMANNRGQTEPPPL